LQFCQFLLHVFWNCYYWVHKHSVLCIFMINWSFYYYEMTVFIADISSWYEISFGISILLLLSLLLVWHNIFHIFNQLASLYLQCSSWAKNVDQW
jgi:hypothetical protein